MSGSLGIEASIVVDKGGFEEELESLVRAVSGWCEDTRSVQNTGGEVKPEGPVLPDNVLDLGLCDHTEVRCAGLPNGSRLSCGRNARGRKELERQTKRLASEATQLLPTCERPAASCAC